MRLLIIVNVDWFFCSHRLPIAIAAKREGYDVHIATTITDHKLKDFLSNEGFKIHELNIDRGVRSYLSIVYAFFSIYEILRLVKPDLLHLVTIQPVLLGGLSARLLRTKNVVYAISGLGHVFIANSPISKVRKYLVLFLYRIALGNKRKRVIFQNPNDLQKLSLVSSINSSESLIISGSGVDISKFISTPLSDDVPIVLMASRLLMTKGVSEFVQAASILKSRGVRSRFQLVGDPDPSNPASVHPETLIKWKIKGDVEFLGYRSDLHLLMQQCHIVALPSYYPEGLPKVLCEAAACGRAVVTTDEAGCRDAIEDRITGLLVPSRNTLVLANALIFLLSNPRILSEMGFAARKRAEQYFDIHQIVQKHLNVYSDLLNTSE